MSKQVTSVSTATMVTEVMRVFLGTGQHRKLDITVSPVVPTQVLYMQNIPSFLTVPEFLQQCEPFLPFLVKVTIVASHSSSSFSSNEVLAVGGSGDQQGNDGKSNTTKPKKSSEDIRICSSSHNDTYSVLVVLTTVDAAVELRTELNEKPLSVLAKENLHVLYVSPTEASSGKALPVEVVPLLYSSRGQDVMWLSSSSNVPSITPSSASLHQTPVSSQHPQPQPTTTTVDTNQCSICLELLSAEAELTTVCGHNFHVACFMKVQDDHCPLCRYNPNANHSSSAAHCADCNNTDDLWMCLVCGMVQCGRYSSGHGVKHYQETQHCMSVEVGGFRVWDYLRDAFVHRLVSMEDSSGGELETTTTTATGSTAWWALGDEEEAELEAVKLESKTDFIAEFYSQILMHQLQQQQQYFEGQLAAMANKNAFSSLAIEEEGKRRELLTFCIQGYKEISSSFKAQLTHNSREKKRSKMKRVKEELEVLNATVDSLLAGRVKCEQLLKAMREKKQRPNPEKDLMEKLEAEVGELYAKFA